MCMGHMQCTYGIKYSNWASCVQYIWQADDFSAGLNTPLSIVKTDMELRG